MSDRRAAARLLLIESDVLRPILERTPEGHFDRPTICTGWSVRDVLAHCGSALTMTASGDFHDFTPEDNERDVEERRPWALKAVLDELSEGYRAAAEAIDTAGGDLDGIGLGEWVHGGDVRLALGKPRPYASEGSDLAVSLMVERSVAQRCPPIDVSVDGAAFRFGAGDEAVGSVTADVETFIRLCSGRDPDPSRYRLDGVEAGALVLFD